MRNRIITCEQRIKKKGTRKMPKQKCPLCDRVAQCGGIDFGLKIQFNCSNCKWFVITDGAEGKISSLPEGIKQDFISQSQNCPEHHVLHITTDKSGSIKARCRPESDLS